LALAGHAKDAEYLAFRRNVERDVALGATPVAALEFQLRSTGDGLYIGGAPPPGPTSGHPRKP
jgi:hypothetical protein